MQAIQPEATVLTTLMRGMRVLELIAEHPDGILPKRLALDTGLKAGTCYHLLRTLRSMGYVTRLSNGRFVVGPQGASLARRMQIVSGPIPQISALLTDLHTVTNETSYLSGWNDGSIVLQQFMEKDLRSFPGSLMDVGYAGNMHARASCKSVLAFLPDNYIESLIDGLELVPLTEHTTAEHEHLMRELRQIRKRGYAFDREEFVQGVACISAPYFDATDMPAGSFTVSLPVERFNGAASFLTRAVRTSAARATAFLKRDGTPSLPRLASPPAMGQSPRQAAAS